MTSEKRNNEFTNSKDCKKANKLFKTPLSWCIIYKKNLALFFHFKVFLFTVLWIGEFVVSSFWYHEQVIRISWKITFSPHVFTNTNSEFPQIEKKTVKIRNSFVLKKCGEENFKNHILIISRSSPHFFTKMNSAF